MDHITIRPAAVADVDIIAANGAAMALETEGRKLEPETVRAGVERVLSDADRGVYYVAQRGERVVGQLLITREWSDWRNGWFWWIQSVYVRPEARGIGVYRALHQHVAELARRTPGVCGLRLYVDRKNTAARGVYERLGMRPTNYEFLETSWAEQPIAAGAGHGAGGLSLLEEDDPRAAPEVQPPAPASAGPKPEDIDLYCLNCGYNLRGLSGDPRRCPECGYLNPVGDLYLPAEVITRQLRKMETPLAASALAAFVGIPCCGLLVLVATGNLGSGVFELFLCSGVPCVLALLGWSAGCVFFRRSCQAQPGWAAAFLKYQFYALLLVGLVAGPIVLCAAFLWWTFDVTSGGPASWAYTLVMLCAGVGYLLAIRYLVNRVHRRLKVSIEPLQRETAVRIARDRVRRRMARPRRGLPRL